LDDPKKPTRPCTNRLDKPRFFDGKIENNSWDPLQQVSFKWFWDGKQFNVMK
jgi:hypothetical protein